MHPPVNLAGLYSCETSVGSIYFGYMHLDVPSERLSRTSVVVRRGNKAVKILRRVGTTSMTEMQRLVEDDSTDLNRRSIGNEMLVYKHPGHYHGIPKVEIRDEGIEMAYWPNGTLKTYLQEHEVEWPQKPRWIQAAADTIHFIRTKGVIHGDISTMNFLIDCDLSLLAR